ncbi:hypothetical protein CANINC_000748 [Pichia inconspicua]|uniref:Uncharacterized protein n=1 Tax=Pichia inconspicua TaxID=52247 RepID=A0A4T0X5N1_9ASCO|nr:hypothetical protein CANINC_000748 [[Candida] inconspicua]
MKLLASLCLFTHLFFCFTHAIPITHSKDGLLGLIYKCETIENCQNILVDNNYEQLTPIASFIQHRDDSLSFIDDQEHQKPDFANSNMIVYKQGYFKSSESGIYGFHSQKQNILSSFQIGNDKQINLDTDNSNFWIHLDHNTVYNFRIATIIRNEESLSDGLTVFYSSGTQVNFFSSVFYTQPPNIENNVSLLNIFKREDSNNLDSGNDNDNNTNNNKNDNNEVTATTTYEVHYGSPNVVKRSWWDCDDKLFTYTCSGVPTTEVISGITANMYYTTCVMPSYMMGHYGGAWNIQIFSVGDTTITAALTDWTVGTITCTTPTTLIDPTGSTVTAICTDLPSEIDYGVNYARDVVISSCNFSAGVSATFLETSSTTVIDNEYTSYITDTDVPTFSPVISTIT